MFVFGGVNHAAEPNLECYFFASVAVQIESERVEAFVTKGIGRGNPGIRIHRHGHDCRFGTALKQIEVAQVDAGIFSGGWRIEVVRHLCH